MWIRPASLVLGSVLLLAGCLVTNGTGTIIGFKAPARCVAGIPAELEIWAWYGADGRDVLDALRADVDDAQRTVTLTVSYHRINYLLGGVTAEAPSVHQSVPITLKQPGTYLVTAPRFFHFAGLEQELGASLSATASIEVMAR